MDKTLPGVTRVAILDDHQSIVDGYCYRLNQTANIQVIGTIAYGDELEPFIVDHPMDVLILDVNVPSSPDNPNPYPILHLIPGLIQRNPDLTILVISMHNQRTLIQAVLAAGASGYIVKDDRDSILQLGEIVRSIALGGVYLSPQAHEQLIRHRAHNDHDPMDDLLTPRQREVLSLCAAYPGSTTAELAQKLGVENSTVRNLLSGAYLRLNVSNRTAAIARARQIGLIAPSIPPPCP